MIETEQIDRIEGSTAYDAAGQKVGRVGQLYLDDQSGRPSWITVSTGLFGTAETFVPLEGASFDGDDLRLAYSKDTIKNAPRVDTDEHLDRAEEAELYRHYGLGDTVDDTVGTVGDGTSERYAEGTTTATGLAGTTTGTTTAGSEESLADRHTADTATSGVEREGEAGVTLSEERLRVATEQREAGRARLRKYVVTEHETITVPVRKEKLVVEHVPAGETAAEPITGADGESEIVEEITLREERVVVGKETVAVEHVRVGKQQVTEEQEITEQVRRERADVDIDRSNDPGAGRPTH